MKSFAIMPFLIATTLAVAQMSNDLSKGIPRHEQIQQEQVQTQDGYDQMSDEQFDYRRQPSIPQPQYHLNHQHYYALQQQQIQEQQQRQHLQTQQPSYVQNSRSNSDIFKRIYFMLPTSVKSIIMLILWPIMEAQRILSGLLYVVVIISMFVYNKLVDKDEDGRSSMTDNALRLFQMAQQVYSAIDKQQE